jgi:SagB-type dehydrogenase family enzyme
MKNREIEATWNYHNGTKHSYQTIRASKHYLDWDNQPVPFKIYSTLQPIPLSEHLSPSGVPALLAVSAGAARTEEQAPLTSQALAEILFLSAGITKRRSYPGGEMLFRAAACTGALYHIDLYLICGDVEGLAAGVYHFSPHDFALRRLRAGDYRSLLARATGNEPSIVNARCAIVSASTFWRNAWKYQARAYRHCYWDNGTILANLLAAAAARQVPAKIVLGFVDPMVNQLLGLETQREAPLTITALGDASTKLVDSFPALEAAEFETAPLSKTEIEYPAMRDMHDLSSLVSEQEVRAWRAEGREEARRKDEGVKKASMFALRPLADEGIPQDSIEEVILRRGSTREFSHESISFAQLSTMLDRASRGIPADFLNDTESALNGIYLIVNAVEDLPPGAYYFHRESRALELLKDGDFRREAGYLGLGQEIPADCSVNVYFLADLHRILERFGNRGYRAAQLEAAIMGGKLYLAAYAQRLGASGLTFFDDDVTDFFSPHAAGKSVMFLIASGKSVTRRKGLNVI